MIQSRSRIVVFDLLTPHLAGRCWHAADEESKLVPLIDLRISLIEILIILLQLTMDIVHSQVADLGYRQVTV